MKTSVEAAEAAEAMKHPMKRCDNWRRKGQLVPQNAHLSDFRTQSYLVLAIRRAVKNGEYTQGASFSFPSGRSCVFMLSGGTRVPAMKTDTV